MEIPKIIHQIWVGQKPIPTKSVEFIKKIKELHPDFEYRLWTDKDINPYNFNNYNYILQSKSFAQKADIMRYEILYRYGGIYLDIDFEVFKKLDNLLTHDLIVCNEDKTVDKYMSIGFIACTKGNLQLKNCVSKVPTINFNLPVNEASGPHFFRRCIELSDSVRVLPTKYMYPLHYKEKHKQLDIDDEIYALHHWDKNW
jgi:mannosyltransferase OCH1-like enzyme